MAGTEDGFIYQTNAGGPFQGLANQFPLVDSIVRENGIWGESAGINQHPGVLLPEATATTRGVEMTNMGANQCQDFAPYLEQGSGTPSAEGERNDEAGLYQDPATYQDLAQYPATEVDWTNLDSVLGDSTAFDLTSFSPWGDNTFRNFRAENGLALPLSSRRPFQPDVTSARTSHPYPASAAGDGDFYPSVPSNVTSRLYPSSDPGADLHPPSPSNASEYGAPDFEPISDHASEEPSESLLRKRKASSFEDYDRVVKARDRNPVPDYEVKMSKNKKEIKCASWLLEPSKKNHDQERAMYFRRWGVQPDHHASCILICEDWRLLYPSDLKDSFSADSCPSTELSRCSYRYDGFSTTLPRATAWYSKWPRRGIELDNLNGTDYYKLMDASHLCHQEHCIVHITYEGADTNQDRKQCHEQARWMRARRIDNDRGLLHSVGSPASDDRNHLEVPSAKASTPSLQYF
ncbi:MAG: hypothetical protein Q9198_000064 [Flavoplaca austrocitrina]